MVRNIISLSNALMGTLVSWMFSALAYPFVIVFALMDPKEHRGGRSIHGHALTMIDFDGKEL